ncbi:Ras/Rap GTPase-activating protein SynGAP [Oryzias melastigma]|uniref:Ras/Rap GTPase-activating protein SynGAP n=1 Tax=Oryzias melastigma TaxID=30732 RepID=A0A834F0U5_ORYME|nr:Ras/Rap GTPase-activating protein SynGAP [Oryzias melastigma]
MFGRGARVDVFTEDVRVIGPQQSVATPASCTAHTTTSMQTPARSPTDNQPEGETCVSPSGSSGPPVPMEQLVKHLSRCQHLGWMNVIELKSASIHWLSCGRKAEPDIWTKMFCILTNSQLLMLDDLEVHPLLLAERAETCTVWLLRYTLHVTSAPHHPAHKGEEK